MKRVLIFFLIFSVGCDKNRDNKTKNRVDNEVKTTIASQLNGHWLSDRYLLDVESSRSIYDSRNYQTKFWGFKLEKENLLSDSATINAFTHHEGGYGGAIKFDYKKNVFVNDLGNVEEFSELTERFEIKLIDSSRLELDFGHKKERYRKIPDEQIALRELLFEGKFKDLLHGNNAIEFLSDGQIKGLDNQEYFELVFDFGEGVNYDASIFYPDKDSSGLWRKGDLFHFEIKADTLKLYRITPDWDEMNHKIGDLEYLLVKSSL